MNVYNSVAWALVQFALFCFKATLGKQAMFKKAAFGYIMVAMQGFLLKTHMNIPATTCISFCLESASCGSLVYIRSSRICKPWTGSGINNIPLLAVTAKSDDEQVWIRGKQVF